MLEIQPLFVSSRSPMLHLERPEEAMSLLHLQMSLSGIALGSAALGGSREAGLS